MALWAPLGTLSWSSTLQKICLKVDFACARDQCSTLHAGANTYAWFCVQESVKTECFFAIVSLEASCQSCVDIANLVACTAMA